MAKLTMVECDFCDCSTLHEKASGWIKMDLYSLFASLSGTLAGEFDADKFRKGLGSMLFCSEMCLYKKLYDRLEPPNG